MSENGPVLLSTTFFFFFCFCRCRSLALAAAESLIQLPLLGLLQTLANPELNTGLGRGWPISGERGCELLHRIKAAF